MRQTLLITGGAGYIGSHTAYLLYTLGYNVIILDTFVHKQPFPHTWATIIRGDCGDAKILQRIFSTYTIDAVMHFAAFIEVGQSVKEPGRYYHNNVVATLTLLDVMRQSGVDIFIFSSSCAVYGNPEYLPITEGHPFAPLSPYGKNKLCVEFALQDYAHAYGLHYVALRYFNAVGCWPEQNLREYHKPETHIIPLLVHAAMNQMPFTVFGDDYPTPDGTCIRDYVHVRDIAQAHVRAYAYLKSGGPSAAFNLGAGIGYSVKELIAATESVCDRSIIIKKAHRREGDVHTLIACSKKARNVLGWKLQERSISSMIREVCVGKI